MRIETKTGAFHLSYSTNVHPAETLADVERMLAEDVGRVRDLFAPGAAFGVELRLGLAALAGFGEGESPALRDFAARLRDLNLYVFSLNGFPLRDFHAPSVKEEVYRPDWSESERQDATVRLAEILAFLLPDGLDGSISTSPGSFRTWGNHRALRAELARGYAPIVAALNRIRRETGKTIRLAVEPEPFCTYETIHEFVEFVQSDARRHTVEALGDHFGYAEGAAVKAVREFLGLCLDASHLAVEFERPTSTLDTLRLAGIPILKLHVSSAARVLKPMQNREGRKALARLAEPKYLHQTFAAGANGAVVWRGADLPEFLALDMEAMKDFAEVRTHFHMPLTAPPDAPLGTTAKETETLLQGILAGWPGTHIVNETYTWSVLPAGLEEGGVHGALARELAWTRDRMTR